MEHLWEIALSAIVGFVGWWSKMLHGDIKKAHDDLSAHKLHVAENYVNKSVLDVVMEEVKYVRKGVDDIKEMLMKVGK
jgi:hypothetical protein